MVIDLHFIFFIKNPLKNHILFSRMSIVLKINTEAAKEVTNTGQV
jgi:hypothetical protein